MKRRAVLLLSFLIFVMNSGFVSFAAGEMTTAVTETDIKITKNISVSATSQYPGFSPDDIIDGRTATGWVNGYYPSGYNSFTIDLSSCYNITKIRFYNARSEVNERKNITIEVSEDGSFENPTEVYVVSSPYSANAWQTVNVGREARYVRFRKNDSYNSTFSMYEAEVYTDNLIYNLSDGATAYSSDSALGTNPQNVIDNNSSTYWCTASEGECGWCTLDIGAGYVNYDIENVKVLLADIENDSLCRRRFVVEAACNSDFSDAVLLYEQGRTLCVNELVIDLSDSVARYRYIRIKKSCTDEYLAIKHIKVYARSYMGENAAANRRAVANSVYMYTEYFHPGSAVDESFDETSAWCSSDTDFPASPVSITVDMEKVYEINTIIFKIQGLKSDESFGGFRIIGSKNENFTDSILIYSQPDGEECTGKKYVHLKENISIRYLRVVKTSANAMLGVAEIQAFTRDTIIPPSVNYAELRNIAHKSNGAAAYANYPWAEPDNAIDGDYGTGYYNQYCGSFCAYWTVDFGEGLFDIKQIKVKISDRDNPSAAAKNFRIELSDNIDFKKPTVIYTNTSSQGLCGTETINPYEGAVTVTDEGISYSPLSVGKYRYMRIIRNEPDGNIKIYEAEVYGKRSDETEWYVMTYDDEIGFTFNFDVSGIKKGSSVIVAGYSDGRLVDCQMYKVQGETAEPLNISGNESIEKFKVFVWDIDKLTTEQNAEIINIY